MTKARTHLIRLLCGLALLWGSPIAVEAQSAAKRQALESEMATLVSGMRALSSCPNLLEEWEYAVLGNAARNLIFRLTGRYQLPPATLRSLYANADADSCTSTTLKTKADELRVYAHSRWLGISRAFLGEPTCPQPSGKATTFLKAVEADVITAYQNKKAPGPSLSEITAFADHSRQSLKKSCPKATGYFNAQNTTLAPYTQWQLGAMGKKVHHREFNFNAGYTMGTGDAGDPNRPRPSGIKAQRSTILERRLITARASLCGGEPLKNKIGITSTVRCTAKIDAAGTLTVTIVPENPAVKLDRAALVIFDPKTKAPIAGTPVRAKDGASVVLLGALKAIKGATPYQQVYVRLGLKNGKSKTEIIDFQYDKKFVGPPTVAAIDFMKAADYAFAPRETDLSLHGIVARNAKGLDAAFDAKAP